MTIFRLQAGLVVHSAIAASDAVMGEIDALGPVRFIVVPSASHKLDAPFYKHRYPEALVLTPEEGRRIVETRVAVDGDYSLLPAQPRLSWELLDGVPGEGVFVYRASNGSITLVFNDALMNLPDRLPGFGGWLTGVIGSTGGPKVTKTAHHFIVKDKGAYAQHLLRLAETEELHRIIVGHGAFITEQPGQVLREVAQTLLPRQRCRPSRRLRGGKRRSN